MIAAVVLLLILGSGRSVLGALGGAFIGTLAAAGLVEATQHGELASLHTPMGLLTDLLPIAAVVVVLAFAGSYGALGAALAWTVGSAAAAVAASQTGQAAYLAPLALNALVAATIVWIAARQIGQYRGW